MASTSETGHAKNVANFQDLIEFVIGFGPTYNPAKDTLKLPQLLALKASADAALEEVITKNTHFNNKVNDRMIAFSDVRTLATRLINALQSSEASKETIANARFFIRKMQGKRASAGQTPNQPDAPVPNTISSSQQSYDQLIQHLAGLRSVLNTEPSYAPNETDLTDAAIEAKINDLQTKNTAVATAYTAVSNTRIARNQTLYADNNGLVAIAIGARNYIKSIYGANSPQYALVRNIKFRTNLD